MNNPTKFKALGYLRYLSVLFLLFSLSACSSMVTQQDYDPSRNFADYHTWSWAKTPVLFTPDNSLTRSGLTAERINTALQEQLPGKGLAFASAGTRSDLTLQVTLANVQTTDNVPNYYDGGPWGGPWGGGPWGYYGPWGWGGGPWGPWGGGYYGTSTVQYPSTVLQLDMYDTHDGRLVWRGRATEPSGDPSDPAQRSKVIADLVQGVLSKYPPP